MTDDPDAPGEAAATSPAPPGSDATAALPQEAAGSPWKVVALAAAALVASATMAIGLGSGGLEGGRELDGQWIYCAGEGAPTIWLEPDTGEPGLVWEPVYRELAASRKVCTRDRSGLGRARPRATGIPTAELLAAELATLLEAADEPGPFVLVGRGAGALTLRHLVSPRPPAAIIELDPPSTFAFDENRAAFLAELPSSIRREYEALPMSISTAPPQAAQTITLRSSDNAVPADLASQILAR